MRSTFATRILCALIALGPAVVCVGRALAASEYPARPITMIVPFATGGAGPNLAGFQGGAPATHALMSGRVDCMCDHGVAAVPQISVGAFRA